MFRIITFAAFMLVIALTPLTAKPTKPGVQAKPKAPTKTPRDISIDRLKLLAANGGLTNWGMMELGNPCFSLSGHPSWEGLATVRDDGKVQISWTAQASGDLYIGLYAVEMDGSMTGAYGRADVVVVEANGELTGTVVAERIIPAPVVMGPEF